MKDHIAITSDIHVAGQFPAGLEAVCKLTGGTLLNHDFFINGDLIPFTENGWHEDPGYAAKKLVRKQTGDEERARAAQRNAWNTHPEEMKAYGLMSQRISHDLAMQIIDAHQDGLIGPLQKIWGNATPTVSAIQRRALDLEGQEGRTMMEYIEALEPEMIQPREGFTGERYGDRVMITVPYCEDPRLQDKFLRQAKSYRDNHGVKEVLLTYHENRFPGLVGYEGKPVVMQVMHEIAEAVQHNFKGAEIYEIVGHNHVIPDEFPIRTEEETNLIPLGIDSQQLVAATLLASKGEQLMRVKYEVPQ